MRPRKATNHCLLLLASLAAAPLAAQSVPPLTGPWLITMQFGDSPIYWRLDLTETDGKLTGDLDGDKLEGTRTGSHIRFRAIDPRGGYEDVDATLARGVFTGKLEWKEVDTPGNPPSTHPFTATSAAAAARGTPQRHEFKPTIFYRQFSPTTPPVLHISPGDTIHTTTVDAGGFDENHVHRSLGGNPQTGPFYIDGANPGDTLVIHIDRLRLNRDTAISDDDLVFRATDPALTIKMKDGGKNVTWHLDREHGIATTGSPGDHLKHFTVPLKPMLGCIATAPGSGAIPAGDSGNWGGNMDFNEVIEGNTVYLPVSVPGALLYFGDAHAAQGDGELNGNALETSMDVELTVYILPHFRVPSPLIQSPTHIMAMGLAGTLEDALRGATGSMASWLARDYNLTPSEAAQVLGTSAEYRISEVADRNAGIVLKLAKARLAAIEGGSPASTPTTDPSIPIKQ